MGGMISVHNLSKRYGETQAVSDLTFEVRPGLVTGFLGPNGAGKSTTMRMVLGLDRPDGGVATIHGKRYEELAAPAREVGALLDATAVQGNRTARMHVAWVAQAVGISKRRVDEVLDLAGLTGAADRQVAGFSLGMHQRLGIAVALLADPPVLVLDEPANGLDAQGVHWVRTLTQELAREGRTVFLSSHLMSEMEQTADHVVVIRGGMLVADAPIRELTSQSARTSIRIVSPHASELIPALEDAGATVTSGEHGTLIVHGVSAEQVGDLAWERRLKLHELATQRASLEEAFLDLTEEDHGT